MTNARFDELFGGPARKPDELLDAAPHGSRCLDPGRDRGGGAAADPLRSRPKRGCKNLCLAGGVALNCVANGKVLRDGRFEKIWIQPAAGDAGGALGAALAACIIKIGSAAASILTPATACTAPISARASPKPRSRARLTAAGAQFTVLTRTRSWSTPRRERLADEQGRRLVPGPHGVRSARARRPLDPRRSAIADMQKTLNLKVKYRESFRPFAPSVLREDVADWFELDADSPTCCCVAPVKRSRQRAMTEAEQALFGIDKLNVPRSDIPAVTHVDYSARIQTVHADTNPRYHALISRFKALPAARCWSTPASTCAASRSSARRRMRSAASWAPRSTCW